MLFRLDDPAGRERFERYRALERQRRQTDLPRAANEVAEWLNMSALGNFEVPGPVRSMYFSNIDPAEHKIDSMFVPLSNYTQDIPPKYNDFIREVKRILRQVGSRPPSADYDEMHDYIIITAIWRHYLCSVSIHGGRALASADGGEWR